MLQSIEKRLDATQFYAMAAGGCIALLLIVRSIIRLRWLSKPGEIFLRKHFLHPLFVRRHRLLGPWTRAGVIFQIVYLAANVFCTCFRVTSASDAAKRAAHLSLINLLPAYFGLQLAFVSTLLGVSFPTYRIFHRSTGTMSVLLGLLHAVLNAVGKPLLGTKESKQIFELIAVLSMVSLLLLSSRVLRRFSYEFFLRCHQGLAFVLLYVLWRHVPSGSKVPRVYLLASSGIFLTTLVMQFLTILYRNFSLQRGCSKASIARQNGTVRMTIFPPRPWKVKAGQHVNVWIPSVSLWSFLQSHPFTVASWTEGENPGLDFLIEPRDGLTRKMFARAPDYEIGSMSSRRRGEGRESKSGSDDLDKRPFGEARSREDGSKMDLRLALFSGPHCSDASIGDYGKVLMVATGFGIAAQLPFLKELIQGFNRSRVRTRTIHLLWQLNDLGDEKPAIELLDRALKEDTLDHGYMLQVWLFFRDGRLDPNPQFAGEHRRVLYHNGTMDLRRFLQDQLKPQSENTARDVLITVSANERTRDELRDLVRVHLDTGVKLLELDYQPAERKRGFWPLSWSRG